MTTSSAEFKDVMVDGQRIVLPTSAQLDCLLSAGELDGVRFSTPTMRESIASLIDETARHPDDLLLGFYRATAAMKSWLPLVLLRTKSGFRRVLTEYLNCKYCGWHGLAANPADPSLYFGTKDEIENLRRGAEIATEKCPSCGKELPRPVAWVEPIPKPQLAVP